MTDDKILVKNAKSSAPSISKKLIIYPPNPRTIGITWEFFLGEDCKKYVWFGTKTFFFYSARNYFMLAKMEIHSIS